MPSAPHSSAATRASWFSAAFDAEYAAAPGPGAGTFLEPMTTTRPPRGASFSSGWHSRISTRLASRLTCITRRHASVVSASMRAPPGKMPALRISMSRPP